jgi:hypothetical protein
VAGLAPAGPAPDAGALDEAALDEAVLDPAEFDAVMPAEAMPAEWDVLEAMAETPPVIRAKAEQGSARSDGLGQGMGAVRDEHAYQRVAADLVLRKKAEDEAGAGWGRLWPGLLSTFRLLPVGTPYTGACSRRCDSAI